VFVGVLQLQQMVLETGADFGAFIDVENPKTVLTTDQMSRENWVSQ
jgi:hypothetical protein